MEVKFERVPRIALALAGVEEGSSYGTPPGFKVKASCSCGCIRISTRWWCAWTWSGANPETYFITDHYLNYPWILVRLARVRSDALPDLIQMAWREARASKRRRDISGASLWYHFAQIELAPQVDE